MRRWPLLLLVVLALPTALAQDAVPEGEGTSNETTPAVTPAGAPGQGSSNATNATDATNASEPAADPASLANVTDTTLLANLTNATPPPSARSNDTWFYRGGEPGIRATIEGLSLEEAASAGNAIRVDPDSPVDLSISIAPPENTTWRVKSISVGLLISGPGTEPPEALARKSTSNSTLPPGFTVVLNRSIELSSLKRVGAGTFLMRAEIRDVNETSLYSQEFYVRIPASLSTILTAQGATLTAISVATGYGFWSIAKDVKEMRDAWARHRKRKEGTKLDVIGRSEHLAEDVVAKAGKPAAEVVDIHRAAQDAERSVGPIRWAATGLGLGGVAIAWGQFLGYVAFDLTNMVVTAMEACAAFLTVALLANVLIRRARQKREAERTVTLIPEDVSQSRADGLEAVQPPDKRD